MPGTGVDGVIGGQSTAQRPEGGYGAGMPQRLFLFVQSSFHGRSAYRTAAICCAAGRGRRARARGGAANAGRPQVRRDTGAGEAAARQCTLAPARIAHEPDPPRWPGCAQRSSTRSRWRPSARPGRGWRAWTLTTMLVRPPRCSTGSSTPIASPAPIHTPARCPPHRPPGIRAGWGEGEQVAEGRWLHAVELGAGELHGGEGKGRVRGRRRSRRCVPRSAWRVC